MYYDIVGSLPLELVAQVAEYLDLGDVVRSQRVSKRWRTIFSSETIITPLLRETLTFLDLDSKGVSTYEAITDAIRYFRWRRGLEHVRPVKGIFLPSSELFSNVPQCVLYNSRRLLYTIFDEVKILDLETGETSTWAGSGTGSIAYFAMSGSYLVLVSTDWDSNHHDFSAWNIHTKQKLSRRMPYNSGLYKIVGHMVVITGSRLADRSSLYVWDLISNHIQRIGSFPDLILCHVDAAENVLVAFETSLEENLTKVQQTKWAIMTGQLLEKKIIHLPTLTDSPISFRTGCITYGHRTVTHLPLVRDVYSMIHLEYDHSVSLLSARWIDGAVLSEKKIALLKYPSSLSPSVTYRWTYEGGQVAVYNASTGFATLCPIQFLGSMEKPIIPERPDINEPVTIKPFFVSGDPEVLTLTDDHGVRFWFFNPEFAPDSVPKIKHSMTESGR